MTRSAPPPGHPGTYVREKVIPAGMTVKDAAELLGVGRPALSNFLNGKAALSPDMAARLERAFGEAASRAKLLALQAAFDGEAAGEAAGRPARPYVPALTSIKARQIEDWAERLEARSELPALLRTLVNGADAGVTKSDFPAYDNAERKGWDGLVHAARATPWIPAGASGWEFGCNRRPAEKAEGDYAARRSLPESERVEMTFVFVTPRNWEGKEEWAKAKRALGEWKDVRAYDASDLEQWLAESMSAQIWLAERLGIPVRGCRSLDECWHDWASPARPALAPELFAPAITAYIDTFQKWLAAAPTRPFIVAADSAGEALAFLACLMRSEHTAGVIQRDLPVVFDAPETLRSAAAGTAPFIPVIYKQEAEREIAPLYQRTHCIIVRPRNAIDSDPDITLDLLGHEDFRKALAAMNVPEHEADSLARRSARSPTILRRCLTHESVGRPSWAADAETARRLVPMGLIGAWHAGTKSDCEVMSLLAGAPYDEVEKCIVALRHLDDSPLWSSGQYRGVTSKADAIFAIAGAVIPADLRNFFLVAELVLSERDPKLDLPEEDRWAAGLHGKLREHSSALRAGIRESLVILAVHGDDLFKDRLGLSVTTETVILIRRLLKPLTLEKLLSHDDELPFYAEAAPEEFLTVIEEDLKTNEPALFGLLRPVDSALFGADCPRSGLLWALETLAWKPENLRRVIPILGRLCTRKIDDNWANKPEETLQAIFRSWMPQTAAPLEQRIQALELLIKRFPEVGWQICAEQFSPHSRIGRYSHRPSFRSDASGAGQPLTGERGREHSAFIRKCVELALAWPRHDEKTLGDLTERLEVLSTEHADAVWDLIDKWADTGPGEDAKAALRERIRRFAFTRRGQRRGLKTTTRNRAAEALKRLAPADPVVRHRWLFASVWVEESLDEIESGDHDYKKREERIEHQRTAALHEIWTARGFAGLKDLLTSGNAPHVAGYIMAAIIKGPKASVGFVRQCLSEASGELETPLKECLRGYFLKIDADAAAAIATALRPEVTSKDMLTLYVCLPLRGETWRLLDGEDESIRREYWASVPAYWNRYKPEELNELIDGLLEAGRPGSAFRAVHLDWKNMETSRLKRLLFALGTASGEKPEPGRLQPYEISEALDALGRRSGISVDEMAQLEFMYLKVLDHSRHGIPNLEKQIARSPGMYVEAIALTYKRTDGQEEPPEWRFEDKERHSRIASATYTLLTEIKRIPGTGDDGKINTEDLKAWLTEVRTACARHGRARIADEMIGQLLAKAPADGDGLWPCRPVCEVLEWIATQSVASGFHVATYNSRGVHWRGEGGDQERDLAARYRSFAQRLAFEYPFVANTLEGLAASYDREAQWHDTDAKVRSRRPY
jgi:addiction module HigA family antidote